MRAFESAASQGLKAAGRYLPYAITQHKRAFMWQTAVQLTAGTAILIWLCDAVKAKGLSDGYSLVFGLNLAAGGSFISIFYTLPRSLRSAASSFGLEPVKPARCSTRLPPLCEPEMQLLHSALSTVVKLSGAHCDSPGNRFGHRLQALRRTSGAPCRR